MPSHIRTKVQKYIGPAPDIPKLKTKVNRYSATKINSNKKKKIKNDEAHKTE